jgi:trans-aconitate 2-methyltransferase
MRRPILAVGRRVRFAHVRRVVRTLPPARRVLDAGCGDGRLAYWLARHWPAAEVVGIDADPEVLEQAARNLADSPRARVELAAIGGDRVGDPFDLVVCVDVLEHLRDDRPGVRWLAEHVAEGGRLLVHVPAAHQWHPLRSVALRMQEEVDVGEGPHFREGYTPASLSALVADAGLAVETAGWTFHGRVARTAVDVDQWTFFTGRRAIKAALLPALLLASTLERASASQGGGHGVLLVARREERSSASARSQNRYLTGRT